LICYLSLYSIIKCYIISICYIILYYNIFCYVILCSIQNLFCSSGSCCRSVQVQITSFLHKLLVDFWTDSHRFCIQVDRLNSSHEKKPRGSRFFTRMALQIGKFLLYILLCYHQFQHFWQSRILYYFSRIVKNSRNLRSVLTRLKVFERYRVTEWGSLIDRLSIREFQLFQLLNISSDTLGSIYLFIWVYSEKVL